MVVECVEDQVQPRAAVRAMGLADRERRPGCRRTIARHVAALHAQKRSYAWAAGLRASRFVRVLPVRRLPVGSPAFFLISYFGIRGTVSCARAARRRIGSASPGSSYSRTQTHMTKQKHDRSRKTASLEPWVVVVRKAFRKPGEAVLLKRLYDRIAGHERTRINPHWRDKIRQVLQRSPMFEHVDWGVWRLRKSPPNRS